MKSTVSLLLIVFMLVTGCTIEVKPINKNIKTKPKHKQQVKPARKQSVPEDRQELLQPIVPILRQTAALT